MIHIDHLTVFVAAFIGFIIGSLWYSPLIFGSIWMKLAKVKPASFFVRVVSFIAAFFLFLIVSYMLALVEGYLAVTSFWDGVIAGVLMWIGFIFPALCINLIFLRKGLKLFCIDIFFWLIFLMATGGILAG